jgi:hypothetical protein
MAAGHFESIGYLALRWLEATDRGKVQWERIYAARLMDFDEITATIRGSELVDLRSKGGTPVFLVEPSTQWSETCYNKLPEFVVYSSHLQSGIDLIVDRENLPIKALAWSMSNADCVAIRDVVESTLGIRLPE